MTHGRPSPVEVLPFFDSSLPCRAATNYFVPHFSSSDLFIKFLKHCNRFNSSHRSPECRFVTMLSNIKITKNYISIPPTTYWKSWKQSHMGHGSSIAKCMCHKTRRHVYKTRPMFGDMRFQSPDLIAKSSSIDGLSENRPFEVSPVPREASKV